MGGGKRDKTAIAFVATSYKKSGESFQQLKYLIFWSVWCMIINHRMRRPNGSFGGGDIETHHKRGGERNELTLSPFHVITNF